ncbi:MAG: hypothetical protein Q4B63_11210 [Clostridium perfringens]|nr:hypothetical protein [Clostridium perfringens]
MDCKITKKMIEAYINSQRISQGDTDSEIEYIKESAKKKLFEDIKKEIIELEKERILKEAEEKIKKLEQQRRIKEIRVLMYEGFIIAFVVGLIVNQATDLLNISKGITTNVVLTLLWIAVLGIMALLVYNNKFLGDIANIIKEKFNND